MNTHLVSAGIPDEAVMSESFQEYALVIQEQYAPITDALFGEEADVKRVSTEQKDMKYLWKIFVRLRKPTEKYPPISS